MNATKHETLPLVLSGALALMTATTVVLALWIFSHLQADLAEKGDDAAPVAPRLEPALPGSTPRPTAPSADNAKQDEFSDDGSLESGSDDAQRGEETKREPAEPDDALDGSVDGEPPVVDAEATFVIDGEAPSELQPGSSSAIDLSFTNVHSYDISVANVSVSIDRVVAPHATRALPCGVSDFEVSRSNFSAQLTISRASTRSLTSLGVPEREWPSIRMINSATNQNGCKGATIELAFTGQGVST